MDKAPDWAFFADNPECCYYARLATVGEIEAHDLRANELPPDCFLYAVSRLKRAQALELQTLFVVLEPQGDMDEADCMAASDAAEDTLVGVG
jgi:hypothetical protein